MKPGDLVIVKRMEHQPLNPGVVVNVSEWPNSIQGPIAISVLFPNTGRVSLYSPSKLKKVA